MKITVLLITGLSIALYGKSQNSSHMMDFNNAKFHISNSGILFQDPVSSGGGYIVPKDHTASLISSAFLWFAAKNENDQLGVAGIAPYTSAGDFQPGPYSQSYSYQEPEYIQKYGSSIWHVTQAEIDSHIQSWGNQGYVIPQNILNWPGNGDTEFETAEILAPFTDLNNNGIYEPQLGESPQIKGCSAVYMILNDNILHEATMGIPLGIEIHYMFYQYASPSFEALNNTTFADISIYNRSTVAWRGFKTGLYIDGDLGNPFDDYVGCDTSRNLMYMYNAGNMDEDFTDGTLQIDGFRANPPAVGILSLKKPLQSFITYDANLAFPYGFPSVAFQYWCNLSGLWIDGSQVLDNNGNQTYFMYHENPLVANSYSETGMGNMPADRRSIISYDHMGQLGSEDPFDHLSHQGKTELSLAIIYNRTGDHLQNLEGLFLVADSIQAFYDDGLLSCADAPLMLEKTTLSKLSVYPNPASDAVTIKTDQQVEGSILLRSVSGAIVSRNPINGSETVVSTLHLSGGVYFLEVDAAGKRYEPLKLVIVK